MPLANPVRKRDRFFQRFLHRRSNHSIGQVSVLQYAQGQVSEQLPPQVYSDILQPESLTTTVVQQHNQGQASERVPDQAHYTVLQRVSSTLSIAEKSSFQDRVFQVLSQEDKDIIQDYIRTDVTSLQDVIQDAHKAAVLKLYECESKKWTIKVGDQEYPLEDKAKKIVKWLDRFKLAGDVAVNVDPLHAGLPWAIIRVLLEAATSEYHQMEALFLGLEEISDMSQLLESHIGYLNRLDDTKPRRNFENTLVKFHALILEFVASALRIYEKGRISRGFAAFWKVDDLSKYKEGFAKLASQAEANASICERYSNRQYQEQQIINRLPYVANAAHSSAGDGRHRSCLENTRVDELQDIINWITKESNKYIYWVRGQAGVGKSTIAMTVAQKLEAGAVISTSFFFLRGGGELALFGKVITTIAYQLAQQSVLLKTFIYDALKAKPELADSVSFKIKFNELLLGPIKKLRGEANESRVVVIILDALDECDDDDQIQMFLAFLGEKQEMIDMGVRILITSRPEYQIRLELEHIKHMELALNDVDRFSVDNDIREFITYELTKIKSRRNIPNSWPGDDVIQNLASIANGSFIYAATICRYICDRGGALAETRLEQVYAFENNAIHASLEPLEEMYSMVLKNSINKLLTPEEVEDFRCLLGGIVLLYKVLSVEELEELMFPHKLKNGRLVQGMLDSMHAVLNIPNNSSGPIQVQHLSFRDFLLNSDRSRKSGFCMDEEEGHRILFDRCLNLMSRCLRRNMCNLTTGTVIQDVSDATRSKYISPQLRYACTYWMDHADCGDVELEDDGLLHQFLLGNLLYWLEVILLLNLWSVIQPLIEGLINKLRETEARTTQMAILLNDTCQLIHDFNKVLKYFPLHLYSTAVVFSRHESIIRQKFPHEVDARIRIQIEPSIDNGEADCSEIVTVIIKPELSLVFSCSRAGIIKIWEDQSGEYRLRDTFECNHLGIWRMNVSFDGSLASLIWQGSSIIVINTLTGKKLHHIYRLGMENIAFSPAEFMVAFTIWDKIIEILDTRTGKSRFVFELPSEGACDMVFSKNGSQLASSSKDGKVCIWDVQKGECIRTLMGRHGWNSQLLYSPDGSLLSSLSTERIMQVWDITSGLELLSQSIPYRFDAWEFNADSSWIRIRGITRRREILEQKDIPIPSRALKLSCFDNAGRNIGSYYEWITYGLESILCIPASYRSALAYYENMLVLGSDDGTMTFIHYEELEEDSDSGCSVIGTRKSEELNCDEFFNSTDSLSSFKSFSASEGSWGAWEVPNEDDQWWG